MPREYKLQIGIGSNIVINITKTFSIKNKLLIKTVS